jgi:O-antigen ligase
MLVFVVANIAVFLANRQSAANALLELLFEYVFLFYFVLLNIRNEKEAVGCFSAILLSACVVCFFGFFEYVSGINLFSRFGTLGRVNQLSADNHLLRLGINRVYVAFSHPIALGGYVLLVFPRAFQLFLNELRRFKKIALLGLCGLLLVTLLLTLSRMPLLCLLLGVILLFLIMGRKQKVFFLKLFCLFLGAVVLCFAVGIVPDFLEDTVASLLLSLTGNPVDNFGGNMFGFQDRLNLFSMTGDVLMESPLFGGGLGYTETHKTYFFDYQRDPYHPYLVDSFDNDHLYRLMSGGIVGFGGYVLLYGAFLRAAFKKARECPGDSLKTAAQAVFVAMTAYLVSLSSVMNLGTFRIFLALAAVFFAAVREGLPEQDRITPLRAGDQRESLI